MAQILQSLSYKECSTLFPKFVAIETSVLILLLLCVNPPSSIIALLLCFDERKYWSIVLKFGQKSILGHANVNEISSSCLDSLKKQYEL